MSESKKAKCIAVVNMKGGATKTTTVRMLIDHAIKDNKRVLCIDLDPQATITAWLGIGQTSLNECAFEASRIFNRSRPIEIGALKTESECDLIPACYAEMLEITERVVPNKELMLKQFLSKIDSLYDVIIVDTPGFMGASTRAAIVACPTLVIPSQTSGVDASSTERFFREVSGVVDAFEFKIKDIYFVPSVYDKRRTDDKIVLADMHESIGTLLSSLSGFNGTSITITEAVPENSSIKDAFSLGNIGGASPQDSLRDKRKKATIAIIDNVCNNILGE